MQNIKFNLSEVNSLLSNLKSALSAKEIGARAGYLYKDTGKKPQPNQMPLEKLALTHQFGTSTIPARPFLSRAQENAQARAQKLIDIRLDQNVTISDLCLEIAAIMQAEIKNQIVKGSFVPNSPATIIRKGSTRPLVDTGNLLQSVHFSVITKTGEKIVS